MSITLVQVLFFSPWSEGIYVYGDTTPQALGYMHDSSGTTLFGPRFWNLCLLLPIIYQIHSACVPTEVGELMRLGQVQLGGRH